jgi:hypothetical protein
VRPGRVVLAGVAAAAAVAVAGCGAGTPVQERRALGGFRSVAVSDGVKVRIVRAAAPVVTVDAGKAVVGRVTTEVRDGVLHVAVRDRGIVIGRDPLRDVRVRVGLPRLGAVEVDGSGDVDLVGLAARSLTLRLRGTGDVTARGRTDELTTDIAGAGDAHLAGLRARRARVVVHGVGDVEVTATEALHVELFGAADVVYHGDPRVTQDVRGPGDVRRAAP